MKRSGFRGVTFCNNFPDLIDRRIILSGRKPEENAHLEGSPEKLFQGVTGTPHFARAVSAVHDCHFHMPAHEKAADEGMSARIASKDAERGGADSEIARYLKTPGFPRKQTKKNIQNRTGHAAGERFHEFGKLCVDEIVSSVKSFKKLWNHPWIMLAVVIHEDGAVPPDIRNACHLRAGLTGVPGKINPGNFAGMSRDDPLYRFEGSVRGGIVDEDQMRPDIAHSMKDSQDFPGCLFYICF